MTQHDPERGGKPGDADVRHEEQPEKHPAGEEQAARNRETEPPG